MGSFFFALSEEFTKFHLFYLTFQERRDVDPRRDERPIVGIRDREHRLPRRGRSRTPPSLTRDLRDTKRRREDTARFCIEFTNLPFRVSEAEIRE